MNKLVYICLYLLEFEILHREDVKIMSQVERTILKIEGMSCSMCKGKVEKALKSISGVTSVSVDLEKKEAIIGGSANPAALVKAVEEIGFKVMD